MSSWAHVHRKDTKLNKSNIRANCTQTRIDGGTHSCAFRTTRQALLGISTDFASLHHDRRLVQGGDLPGCAPNQSQLHACLMFWLIGVGHWPGEVLCVILLPM